ncbi:voltage-gated chloride channel family protein [Paenibacillus glycanilyticus]|uniref:voltage-gated chloride channel family protein n=1 Tax=Paenibacillus glycanilyticus TaxID=126569 RepID=UPI00203B1CF9|nr:voltage-gated chloride channel family protein [Paenibacillus glycanilyticus]MCM3628653.1 voltage-gated chloride channel family protein [Paenibacillus glycanilyticus]
MANIMKSSLIRLGLAVIAGICTGSASALFLTSLEWATETSITHAWLLWLLPVGGALVSWLYLKYGKDAAKGNNLLLDRIYGGEAAVPLRMAPLVLFGTIVTHLFGGSAGREGTAVQMGGSLAEQISKQFKLSSAERKILLLCGISSGFGSVFGTPAAGAMFALEVAALGAISLESILPVILASYAGHYTTLAWGVHHLHYSMGTVPPPSFMLLLKLALAAVLFGLAALLFVTLTHRLKAWFTKRLPNPMVKSFVGGLIIIALVYIAGSRDYLGLGLPLLQHSFQEAAAPLDFLWKTVFTSLTLGTGFQGGEVTPLFVIGSTLGSALAKLLAVSVPLLAGIGLVSIFSGATNTPLASYILGIELFGLHGYGWLYMLIGCAIAYLCSGAPGIYSAQRSRRYFKELWD